MIPVLKSLATDSTDPAFLRQLEVMEDSLRACVPAEPANKAK